MAGPGSQRGKLVIAAQILALTTLYVGLGKLGMSLAPPGGFSTLVWPSAGVALAALLIGGYRLWPGVALGALLTNLWLGAPLLAACGIALGNTLQAAFGSLAVRGLPGFHRSLERFQDVVGLATLAAVVSPMIGATLGAASLVAFDLVLPADFARTWTTWWAGDLVGILIVAPALLTWTQAPRPVSRSAKLFETILLGAVLVGASLLIFGERSDVLARNPILNPYLLFLPLIWAALRHGVRGAATGVLLVAFFAVAGTYMGRGELAREDPASSLVTLHVFLAATSVATLALGAVVSEREHSRAQLDESESRFRSVLDGTIDAVYVKDPVGRYVIMNAPGARLIGLPPEEITGKDDFALFSEEEAQVLRELDRQVARTGKPLESDEHLTIAGQKRIYHTTKTPYRDQQGNALGVIGISRDITERLRVERELQKLEERRRVEKELADLLQRERAARAEAQAAASAKDEFLAVLSHELRTPLQSMLGWTQMLKEKRVDEPMAHKGLETIERNIRTQTQLIEDLLDISRIVAGTIRVDRQPMDLAPVVDSALAAVAQSASAKSIHIEATIDPRVGELHGDPARLEQVLSNLLSNALKFTPPGGHVSVRLERQGASARLVVADDGRGITAEFLPHVFERFRQADSTPRRSHGGLGLGLSIVRHLVELHGGTVIAESPGEGRGATFTVTLPLASEAQRSLAPRSRKAARAGALSATLSGVRVLVVDDDRDACELLEMGLRKEGASVRAVHSVRDALEALDSFHPDLLLSDIAMPEEDGYSLIRRVRAREAATGAHVPAIALTAFASPADREQALSLGFDEHLAKPTSPSDLSRTVARLLRASPPSAA